MLFIQVCSLYYDKRTRSGEAMRRLNAVKFHPVPEISDFKNGELLIHVNRKVKIFPEADHFRYDRIAVRKLENSYQITYTRHPAQGFFKPIFQLDENQYGRIIYNERSQTFDSEWYYIRTVMNFLHADKAAFREKVFFRKEPDYLFEDMAYLRYCGDYHKRRIRNIDKNS